MSLRLLIINNLVELNHCKNDFERYSANKTWRSDLDQFLITFSTNFRRMGQRVDRGNTKSKNYKN